ncbi:MAG: hypothetical protein JO127_10015 [Caulobacteraceae bacterium]|nr:hypothetical protein [Caulobacteraceae bacterium]
MAIVQEGAKVPQEWAIGFAELARRPVPRGVDADAWLAMMNAAGRFLDQWGGKAAALGWTAAELFGLHPEAPIRRMDHRGRAFFLVGAEVLAIDADAITVRVGRSTNRIYRRSTAQKAAWEEISLEAAP